MLELLPVDGLRLGSFSAGIRKSGRTDLVIIEAISGTSCAAVFTKNIFSAAPVLISKRNLKSCDHKPRAFLINSGNANAGNGEQGISDAIRCAEMIADSLGIQTEEVLVFSTGIIGEPLPVSLIEESIQNILQRLSVDGWAEAAEARRRSRAQAPPVSQAAPAPPPKSTRAESPLQAATRAHDRRPPPA